LTNNDKPNIITHMDELYTRLDQAERQIATVKNKVARRDLLKMVQTIDRAMVAADMASVECRRLHRETLHYQELVNNAQKLITNLEQHLTLAVLLGG
jgi:predicted  nucleic acid-binding Zn-ribbon protein